MNEKLKDFIIILLFIFSPCISLIHLISPIILIFILLPFSGIGLICLTAFLFIDLQNPNLYKVLK